jgi:5-methylcytosine-specific restriction endonuclease McrA
MTHPKDVHESTYAQAFVRDGFRCVYCDRDILESFDTFAASHLDHLKPSSKGGPDDDVWNRVSACGVCNNMKGAFDPCPEGLVTEETFHRVVAVARRYVTGKRSGDISCSYHRDYAHWLMKSGRKGQSL